MNCLTYIVIVTYYPNINRIKKMYECVKKSGCRLVIVDNSEIDVENQFREEDCKVIHFHKNRGVAYAQNRGVRYALEHGAGLIGFFDQDSKIDENLIIKLKEGLIKKDFHIVAPVSIDDKTGKEYPNTVIDRFGLPRDVFVESNTRELFVDIVISSGLFVKSEMFEKVGLFDESLFVDFVDIEWCLRSHKAGFKIAIIKDAVMRHSIGENNRKIGFITINVHSPYRTYYKVRNPILLFGKTTNILFCLSQLLPAMIHNVLLIFDKKDGKKYRKYYFQAICDGIRSKDGKYEQWHNE